MSSQEQASTKIYILMDLKKQSLYSDFMITVRVPRKNREAFNLYAHGNFIDSSYDEERGSLFVSDKGVVLLDYNYRPHRRAYIVCPAERAQFMKSVYLPNVREKLALISAVYGRRIDLLRTAIYNIEKIAGKEAYDYPILFWQEVSCLLDNFMGRKSAATKTNLMILCTRFGRKS